jgi:hypothetical protein
MVDEGCDMDGDVIVYDCGGIVDHRRACVMTEKKRLDPLWSDERIAGMFHRGMPGDYYIDAIPLASEMRDEYEEERREMYFLVEKLREMILEKKIKMGGAGR